MYMKICEMGDVLDIITYAKFQNEIFIGYNFTGGRIFHFSYWFWMGLTTVQRYCAACDTVIVTKDHLRFAIGRHIACKRLVTFKRLVYAFTKLNDMRIPI